MEKMLKNLKEDEIQRGEDDKKEGEIKERREQLERHKDKREKYRQIKYILIVAVTGLYVLFAILYFTVDHGLPIFAKKVSEEGGHALKTESVIWIEI